MILPNKLFSYNESALSKIPFILHSLNIPRTPNYLYHIGSHVFADPMELIDTLDCLYALKAIKLNDEGEIERC